MKQDRFELQRRADWEHFATWLERLERARVEPPETRNYPEAYRRLCLDLALAQERGYSQTLLDYLQQLAQRGHQQLYRHRSPLLAQGLGFVLRGLPQLVRREWHYMLAASLLFYGPFLLMGLLVYFVPDLIYSVVDADQVAQMEAMYDPDRTRLGRFGERGSADDWAMFGFYIMNNVGIAFQTFASGVLFGLGSIFYMVFNGITIGAVAGHLTGIGYHQTFWSFVIGHGAFELTAITIAGAAGLRLGWALVAPGRLRRADALREAGKVGVQLVTAAFLMLVIAAFVEAYWSSMTIASPTVKYVVGAALWALVGYYLLRVGRGVDAAA